jgi:hypothetical protein
MDDKDQLLCPTFTFFIYFFLKKVSEAIIYIYIYIYIYIFCPSSMFLKNENSIFLHKKGKSWVKKLGV